MYITEFEPGTKQKPKKEEDDAHSRVTKGAKFPKRN